MRSRPSRGSKRSRRCRAASATNTADPSTRGPRGGSMPPRGCDAPRRSRPDYAAGQCIRDPEDALGTEARRLDRSGARGQGAHAAAASVSTSRTARLRASRTHARPSPPRGSRPPAPDRRTPRCRRGPAARRRSMRRTQAAAPGCWLSGPRGRCGSGPRPGREGWIGDQGRAARGLQSDPRACR